MTKSQRRILAAHTDTHGGLKMALLNPDTILYSEDEKGNWVPYHPNLTKVQEYLWKTYNEQVQAAFDIADGAPMMVKHLGDECNGNKHADLLVSNRMSDQVIIAEYNTRPWFNYKKLTHYRQVVGTGAHNFGFGSSAMLLCTNLQGRYPGVDIAPLYHGLMDYAGVSIDYAHHGPYPGSRDWLKGNVARFYLRDLMMREAAKGRTPPMLVLRAHYHQGVHETLEQSGYTSELYVLPSYSFLNDHAMQATQSAHEITHGLVVWEIEDGKILRTHRLYKTLDTRTKEVIV